ELPRVAPMRALLTGSGTAAGREHEPGPGTACSFPPIQKHRSEHLGYEEPLGPSTLRKAPSFDSRRDPLGEATHRGAVVQHGGEVVHLPLERVEVARSQPTKH